MAVSRMQGRGRLEGVGKCLGRAVAQMNDASEFDW